jgi:elongation factor Ts
MSITATMVKELRDRTGAGMMECKKALAETGGDQDAAVQLLRKKGSATAEKKAGRIAAEGVIAIRTSEGGRSGVMVEINCETDFVAKDPSFAAFAEQVAACVARVRPGDLEDLSATEIGPGMETVEGARQTLIGKIGENVSVRRFIVVDAGDGDVVASYLHGSRIGVLVVASGGDDELRRGIAMHVAASRPIAVDAAGIPPDVLSHEREIYEAQAKESGKPQNIVEKMVEGKVRKFFQENTLLGQPYVRDPDQSVESLLKSKGASVRRIERYEVGEGLQKRADDFVAEVMAQAKGG